MNTKFNIGDKVYIPVTIKEIYILDEGKIIYKLDLPEKIEETFSGNSVRCYDEEVLINAKT